MPILIALGAVLLLALVFGPQVYIRYALRKHGVERPDLPGTGGVGNGRRHWQRMETNKATVSGS